LSDGTTGDANNLSGTSKEPIIIKIAPKDVTILATHSSLPRQNWDNPLNDLRKLVRQIDVVSLPGSPNFSRDERYER